MVVCVYMCRIDFHALRFAFHLSRHRYTHWISVNTRTPTHKQTHTHIERRDRVERGERDRRELTGSEREREREERERRERVFVWRVVCVSHIHDVCTYDFIRCVLCDGVVVPCMNATYSHTCASTHKVFWNHQWTVNHPKSPG